MFLVWEYMQTLMNKYFVIKEMQKAQFLAEKS
jgi:hypothetical protein